MRSGNEADIDVEELFDAVAECMDRLRETAAELHAGTINAHHAANRIEKIANEISRGREAAAAVEVEDEEEDDFHERDFDWKDA